MTKSARIFFLVYILGSILALVLSQREGPLKPTTSETSIAVSAFGTYVRA